MIKRCVVVLLLVVLVSCVQVKEQSVPPQQEVALPVQVPVVASQAPPPRPALPVQYVIAQKIAPYGLVMTGAEYDTFGIVPVERYDARYVFQNVSVLVHVFHFSSREELDYVLDAQFYTVMKRGAMKYQNSIVMLFLSDENHRIAVWSSGKNLVYVETGVPDFAAQEVVNLYLDYFPSDLVTPKCIDTDENSHYAKGKTTRVQIGTTVMSWTDVCLRDFAPYQNKQYVSRKGLTKEDGLLEGLCQTQDWLPGFVDEYECANGCKDGACVI